MFKKKSAHDDTQKDPNQKEYSLFNNMTYIMSGTFRYQKVLLIILPLKIITSAVATYLPSFALRSVINRITERADFRLLVYTALFYTAVRLISALIENICDANIWWRLINAREHFIMLRIRKVLYMDYEYIESSRVMQAQQKAQRATGGNNNGVEGMMHSFEKLMIMLASSLTAIVIICRLSAWALLLVLVYGVLYYLNMDNTKRRDKITWDECTPYWRKQWYMQNTMTNFTYGKDIRLFSMKKWIMGKYAHLQNILHNHMRDAKNRWLGCSMISNTLALLNTAAIYGYLAYRVIMTDVSIADFSLYLGAIEGFNETLRQVFNTVTDMRQQSREVDDFRTFIEYPEREILVGDDGELPALLHMEKYVFTFENVSFKYPDTENYALKDLSLTLEAGERLAVVGLNGAGKSTFVKLLCGLYVPTEGRILLNGIDIKRYDKREYYELFAPVFQNIELFAFQMCENVSMRDIQNTDTERAAACLRDAGLSEKLDTLPKGVETQLLKVIHDDGIDLSGGERQKLAFARALYKNSPIVILDEPTSALDALAEYRMYMNFDRLIGSKSAVYISHRLSSTRFCDHVAMFEGGKLIEYGTHESLMEKGGAYREMFDVQAQYYQEEDSANEY